MKPGAVCIYNDRGVSKESLKHTLDFFSDEQVRLLSAGDVIAGKWMDDAALFVMPGGADRLYAKELSGAGEDVIAQYVRNGGSYLGICAGAYYGSGFVEFDKGGPLEVIAPRGMKFFPGKAIGPVLAEYDYKSNSGARSANILVAMENLAGPVNLFFNGGCYFEDAEHIDGVSVLAWYMLDDKKLPAIVTANYGAGHVVLSGLHFEYNEDLMDAEDEYLGKLLPSLRVTADKRKLLWMELLRLLNLL